ncbi:MAG: HIT family protein [Aristaeellaceae bacterium]
MDCIFCKIVRGELPCRKVHEDEHALVFMDAAGDVDGHMLAVPKKHFESILDCDEDTLDRLMRAVQRVAQHCVEKCGCGGVNLLNASGACAGQSVPHLHIHIIPRRHGDGIDAWPTLPGAKADAEAVFNQLRMD